jgi:hypothetical protein
VARREYQAMQFKGRFSRSNISFPVSGEADRQRHGVWEGSFNYSKKDATTIGVGTAQIITDKGSTWEIVVTGTSTAGASDDAECFFTIQRDPQ